MSDECHSDFGGIPNDVISLIVTPELVEELLVLAIVNGLRQAQPDKGYFSDEIRVFLSSALGNLFNIVVSLPCTCKNSIQHCNE
jgi:hypothetical protein